MFEGPTPDASNFTARNPHSADVDPHEVFSRVFAGNFQQVLREMERAYREQQAQQQGQRRGQPFGQPEMDFMRMMGHRTKDRAREAEEEAFLRMLFGFDSRGKPSASSGGFEVPVLVLFLSVF